MPASVFSGGAWPRTPSATLIIRAWGETGAEQPFRARLVAHDTDGVKVEVGVAGDPDETLAMVRDWINEFLSHLD